MSKKSTKNIKIPGVIWKCILGIIGVSTIISLMLLVIKVVELPILPTEYVVGLFVGLIVLLFLGCFMALRKKVGVRALGLVLMIASLVLSLCGNYYYGHGIDAINSIGNQTKETTTYGIYVLKDSNIKKFKNLKNPIFGCTPSLEGKKLDDVYSKLKFDLKLKKLNTKEYKESFSLAKGLYNHECESIILNEAYVDVLKETKNFKNFKKDVRLLKEYKVVEMTDAAKKIKPGEPFVMYISGMDTWGHISTASRSDVNIIAVINPKTRQVLLVSTPRDYYVPLSISNGAKDKLTHAGIYGIDVSMDTLEMLYDVKIDHYFKLNFSGFEGLINAMGGITVWSDNDFTVEPIKHYKKGNNKLTGLEALAFARERHAFAGGDRVRGQNQMNVIQSVIDKMCSKTLLTNYTKILKECDGTFATDMTSSEMSNLVNFQLAKGVKWDVQKFSVNGSGELNSVYSMSSRVYVMEPNMDDVTKAKGLIDKVLAGEKIDLTSEAKGGN